MEARVEEAALRVAFAAYAFGHASVDLVPMADAPNACPEHIWASLLHAPPTRGVTVRVWTRLLQPDLLYPQALPTSFEGEIPALAKP